MKDHNLKRLLLWCAVIAHMVLIFLFSAQNSTESSQTSNFVLDFIMKFISAERSTNSNMQFFESAIFIVRKMAHFTLYFILSLLVMNLVMCYNNKKARVIFITLVICLLYSISDEIHQYFVPGRACMLFDVGVDFLGSASAALIVMTISTIKNRINN